MAEAIDEMIEFTDARGAESEIDPLSAFETVLYLAERTLPRENGETPVENRVHEAGDFFGTYCEVFTDRLSWPTEAIDPNSPEAQARVESVRDDAGDLRWAFLVTLKQADHGAISPDQVGRDIALAESCDRQHAAIQFVLATLMLNWDELGLHTPE